MHRRFFGLASQTFYHPDPVPAPDPAPAPPPQPLSLTQADLDRIKAEEFGKGKRLGSEDGKLTKAERERLSALEANEALRVKADKEREEKAALERGDFEKARGKVIDSAREEERKAWEPKLSEAQQRIQKLEGRFGGLLKDKVKAAAAAKAYNPDQVVALLVGSGRVRLNADFDPEVLDEHGEPALVGGKPMTVDQLVDGYLAANPNLVKSSGGAGGGAGGGASLQGEAGEIAELEAKVKAAADAYHKGGRRSEDLTTHREATKALQAAKVKAGK